MGDDQIRIKRIPMSVGGCPAFTALMLIPRELALLGHLGQGSEHRRAIKRGFNGREWRLERVCFGFCAQGRSPGAGSTSAIESDPMSRDGRSCRVLAHDMHQINRAEATSRIRPHSIGAVAPCQRAPPGVEQAPHCLPVLGRFDPHPRPPPPAGQNCADAEAMPPSRANQTRPHRTPTHRRTDGYYA